MNEVIVDAALRVKLQNLDDLLRICDESGRILGYFHPVIESPASQQPSLRSPISPEEIERRRRQRTGRSLAEILDDLNRP